MGTAGNIGAGFSGFSQGISPFLQMLMQQKIQQQQTQQAQNQKYAYDASLGKLVPVNPQLNMLPGLGGGTGNIPGYSGFPQVSQPQMISPLQLGGRVAPASYESQPAGSTRISPGAGVPGGYYKPKPEAPGKYEPTTQAGWQEDEAYKAKLKPTKRESDYRSKEYKQDLQSAVEAINNEADKDKVYRRLSAAYPQYSAEIMRVIYGKSQKEEDEDIF